MKEFGSQNVPEDVSEQEPSPLRRIGSILAHEARLTVTLPQYDRVDQAKALALKLFGGGSIGLWTKVASDQPSNERLHSTGELALTMGFSASMALLGLAFVIGANRMHNRTEE